MKDQEKYQLVVLESILKEYGLDYFVRLFELGEETVCLDLLNDNQFVVFNYERGAKHDVEVYYNAYDAAREIFSRVSDSYELQSELTLRFDEGIGKERERGL